MNLLLQRVIESVQGPIFQKMYADMSKSLSLGPASFSAATDFLQGAGQGQIVTQVSSHHVWL